MVRHERAKRGEWSHGDLNGLRRRLTLRCDAAAQPGLVLGATDRTQTAPTTDPVSVEDILHTIFRLMGIDPAKTYYTPLGRPVPIVNGGRMVPGLV